MPSIVLGMPTFPSWLPVVARILPFVSLMANQEIRFADNSAGDILDVFVEAVHYLDDSSSRWSDGSKKGRLMARLVH